MGIVVPSQLGFCFRNRLGPDLVTRINSKVSAPKRTRRNRRSPERDRAVLETFGRRLWLGKEADTNLVLAAACFD